MIPYNNSIIVPVDTGYGNIKNSLHSVPTEIAAYKTIILQRSRRMLL